MKTFAQFKSENNIQTIDLLQGKGRMYAKVNNKQLVVSSKCDLQKPLFVVELNEAIDAALPIETPGNSRVIPDAFLLVNSANVKVVASI